MSLLQTGYQERRQILCEISHNIFIRIIKEIDTTKFTIVYLDVSTKRSAYRLFNRNIQSYEDIIDAYDEVNKRNNVDQIELTKKIIPYLYSCIYINTDNKSSEEIYLEFLKKESLIEQSEERFIKLQNNSIERSNFNWIFNFILQPIKNILEDYAGNIVKKYPYINKNDLIYNTIILLTAFRLQQIYNCDDNFLLMIQQSIINRDELLVNILNEKISNGEIKINIELIFKTLMDSTLNFLQLYKDKDIQEIMIKFNEERSDSNFKFQKSLMLKLENEILDDNRITFKKIDSNISNFISTYCHYLHTPRTDKLVSYGAFINDNEYPIAYVSFSRQDRNYKKEFLYHLGIESQNTVEMTRA